VPVSFDNDIRRVLTRIPPGTVMTYGEVARESGHPGAARAVGNLLSRGDADLPWWRVVTADGRLVPGNEREHGERLNAEGVVALNGRVVMGAGPLHDRTGGRERRQPEGGE